MESTSPAPIHPPHRELWNARTGRLRNRAGQDRPLDTWHSTGFGLYAVRQFARPLTRATGQAVWLLPSLGIRVISWIPAPGETGLESFYIDIAGITVDGDLLALTDYYLDILVWSGHRAEVVDQDEFVDAVAAGHLDRDTAAGALAASYQTLDGLARHGYRLHEWLRTEHRIMLTWPGHVIDPTRL